MALFQRSCTKFSCILQSAKLTPRYYSKTDLSLEKNIKKSVFISQSKDIYTNLAIEQWLYKNFDFTKHHVLMLWQNDPCVVIGRHQNPWSEANYTELDNITDNGVQLVRRSSGGGALYQDLGNLNVTFFTPSERFNARYNFEVLSRGLFREFGLMTEVSSNELVLRSNKEVSGTAAKLGRTNSYHHCSLLVSTNKVNATLALQKHEVSIQSKATLSRVAKMMNLCEENTKVTIPLVMKAIGWEFMRTTALTMKDGGQELANKQNGFQMINPTENWFPGLKEIQDYYTSWDWCYGNTPKFHITQSFPVPGGLIHNTSGTCADVKVTMTVESGKISDITLFVPEGFSSFGFTGEAKVVTGLKGKRFSINAFNELENSLDSLLDEKERFVTECVRQVMTSA